MSGYGGSCSRSDDPPAEVLAELNSMEAVLQLGRLVVGEMPLEQLYLRVAEIARDAVPSADEVSVTIVRGDRADTAASTGLLATRLDGCQCTEGSGPGLEAARTGSTMIVADMSAETRWPAYAVQAVQDGVLSSLSVALPMNDGSAGAFNIYARKRDAFDEHGQRLAHRAAEHAAIAMTNASLYAASALLAEQLRQAMESRAVIEQAKGIIMGERRCSAEEAFAVLTAVSQSANRKLRDIASGLVGHARTR